MPIKTASEKEVQKTILDYLKIETRVVWHARINSGLAKCQKCYTTIYNFKGAPAGTSDILALTNNGKFFAIEVKKNKKSLASEEQVAFLKKVRKSGGIGIIAYDVQDVQDALNGLCQSLPIKFRKNYTGLTDDEIPRI